MSLSRTRLSESELTTALAGRPGWTVEEGMLTRTFTFSAYASGALFACGVMQTAEVMDHHPDVLVTYGRVKVSTSTHDADGLTALDFELARRTDALDRGSAS